MSTRHRFLRIPEIRTDQIEDWLDRLGAGVIDSNLQNEIADTILELLEQRKDSLGSRDKLLFADAITALSINVNSIYQPNETGLRRCLIALGTLMTPDEIIDESYSKRHVEADKINHAMLMATIRILKEQIG